jgi:hypothetical protein
VFVEAIASVTGLLYAIPRYGLTGAATVVAGLMILSRGVVVPWAVSRELNMRFGTYIRGIYSRPLLLATPISLAVWFLNRVSGTPATWLAVLGGGAGMATCYYSLCFAFGLEQRHREMVLNLAHSKLAFLKRAELPRMVR